MLDDEYCIVCDECKQGIYEGEIAYEWEDNFWICPDCFKRKVQNMKLYEFADLLGCNYKTINKPGKTLWQEQEERWEDAMWAD